MVQHICNRCGYTTNRKQNLRSHLLRKNLCKPLMNEIDRYELLVSNGFEEESKMYEKIHNCKPIVNPIVNPNGITISSNICDYCNKKFSTRQGKYKHQKFYCKSKKEQESQNHLMEEILKRLKELEKENKEKDKLIYKLLKNNKSNLNKGIINNANQQINNNNLTINNFGSENIDYITEKVFYKLLNTPSHAIPKLIELKHFDPKHPENHNVKVTNLHDKYAKIYKDKKWLTKNKKEVIDDMIDYCMADFDDFKEFNIDKFTQKIIKYFKKLEEEYDEKSKSLVDKSLLASFNGSEKIYVSKDANNIVV